MRFVEKKKLPFSNGPLDDRFLPDLHIGLYDDVVVLDHVEKVILCTKKFSLSNCLPA